MNKDKVTYRQRKRRKLRVRNNLRGDAERPRLAVFRSHKHVYCQLVDDAVGKTLASASTRDKDLRGKISYGGNRTAAEEIGKAIAAKALAIGISKVCFDRGSYKYHGRVAALAAGARAGGLNF
jgi:large subunit ribosomal protein L18